MQFNSYLFLLAFLPVTVVGYWLLMRYTRKVIARSFLLVCCLVFYSYVNIAYLPILLGSILVNYGLGVLMSDQYSRSQQTRKFYLVTGLFLNIGFLGYCKYTNFFISTLNSAFGSSFNLTRLILPLGISFFTFQQIAYLVDRAKGNAPDYKLLDYALFITYFPTITSGPIAMHNEIITQFNTPSRQVFSSDNFARGLYSFTLGLAKKLFLAELFAGVANWGFSTDVSRIGSVSAVFVMLAYTLQLYFDFSGYSDMASGLSLMFNIELPLNFNSPYKALTIDDFWKRWHMTLTRFLTKYIYYPLGGNRKGTIRTYVNIMIIFLISGLWHGANITFVVWGAMHGLASVISRIFKKQIAKWHPAFSWFSTFIFVSLAWVFFRANSLAQGIELIKEMGRMEFKPFDSAMIAAFSTPEIELLVKIFNQKALPAFVVTLLMAIGLLICVNTRNVSERLANFRPTIVRLIITVLLLFVSILSFGMVTEFLYVNF
jgi:alginate O-acetyltransferase complex protein AlgI